MRTFYLTELLLLTLVIVFSGNVAFTSELEDESLYTPAEIQRNAQRKALGMPPIPPKALRKKVPKKSKGRAGNAGSVPLSMGQTSTGYIAVLYDNIDGPVVGYLSNHKIVFSLLEATEYQYTTTGGLMEIREASTHYRLCVVTGLYGQSLGFGSKNFHVPRRTRLSTGDGDTPFHDHSTAQHLETTVFSLDPATGEIEIHWVNPDRSRHDIHIILRGTRIYYAGDATTFRSQINEEVLPTVVYKWIPKDSPEPLEM